MFSKCELNLPRSWPETENQANKNPPEYDVPAGQIAICSARSEIEHQALRVLEAFLDADEEGHRFLAIDDAVIVA